MRELFLCLVLTTPIFAQKKPITLETLRQTGRGALNSPLLWMPNGESFLFRQGHNLMAYDPATKSSKMLIALDALDKSAVPPLEESATDWTNRRAGRGAGMQLSSDGKELLYSSNGDLFLIHLDTAKWEQLTATPAREIDAVLSPDGKAVAFRRDWDLYTVDITTKKETRLSANGTASLRNGALDWVYPEELHLNTAFWWSPDSKSIAYLQFDISQEPMYPHEDLLGLRALNEPERYPQAGENNATVSLGVVAASGSATRWYDVGETRDDYLITRVGWMPNSRAIYVLRSNRVQNHDELLAIDVESGAHSTIFQESDPYWLNIQDDIRFLRDGKHFLWTSERGEGGYRHIFLYSNDGKEVRQITNGLWEVTSIDAVDEDGHRIFYISDESTHLERHLYSIGFDGRDKRHLTREPGTHNISMGPGGKV